MGVGVIAGLDPFQETFCLLQSGFPVSFISGIFIGQPQFARPEAVGPLFVGDGSIEAVFRINGFKLAGKFA